MVVFLKVLIKYKDFSNLIAAMFSKGERIVGIKAIADYLNTSERTIYRWEKKFGLPLQRVAGTKGTTVYIYVNEVEDWLKTKRPSKKSLFAFSRKTWRLIIFLFLLIILSLTTLLIIFEDNKFQVIKKAPNPVASGINGNIAIIEDAAGKELWSYIVSDIPMNDMLWSLRKFVDFYDIDNDGANEVVSPIYDPPGDRYYLALFDNNGSIIWKRSITNKQTFGELHLKTSFQSGRTRFAKLSNGDVRIITHWNHRTRFPSVITSHSLEGNLLNNYLNIGHLDSFEIYDLDGDGNEEIIFSGTNNLLNGEGVLGVLDLRDFKGICPSYRVEPEYKKITRLENYVPDNPEKGNQLIYLRFKKIDQFKRYQRTYAFAKIHDIESEAIHILLFPWEFKAYNKFCGFEYVFNKKFELIYAIPDSPMQKFYYKMFKNSKKKIPLEEAARLINQNVMRWEGNDWVPVSRVNSDRHAKN